MPEVNNVTEERGGIVLSIQEHPHIPHAYRVTTDNSVRKLEYFIVRWGREDPLPIQPGDTIYYEHPLILWTLKEDINGGSEKIVKLQGSQEPKPRL